MQIFDTTLRDGEQAAGVVFSLPEKIRIAKMLETCGVRYFELGIPAMGEESINHINRIAVELKSSRGFVWARANPQDIECARRCRVPGIHLSFPVSDLHLRAWKKDWSWIIHSLETLVPECGRHFRWVSVGAQDASRTALPRLVDFARRCRSLGVHHLRIADTVGILNPDKTRDLVHELTRKCPGLDLEFHGHNDLGMATANTTTALFAGAAYASTTVNGLGERAGNAAMEEVVMAMKVAYDMPIGIQSHGLTELSRLVEQASGTPMLPGKPIVGSRTFAHESGIHCSGLRRDSQTYECFSASEVGQEERRFVYGIKSGKNAIRDLLSDLGIAWEEKQIHRLLVRIQHLSRTRKRALEKDEVLNLISQSAHRSVNGDHSQTFNDPADRQQTNLTCS